jgi:ribosomal protein S18 acetylase RimI-like enzyme
MLARIEPHHRVRVADLLTETPEFTPAEVAVALELVDAALANPVHSGYQFVLHEEDDRVLGYACFGPTPMTDGCFDLYWLVTHPAQRRKGVARRLLVAVELEIEKAWGRMVRVETSGLESYRPAQALYERAGYTPAARIRDFYAPGNDLHIWVKYLEPSALSAER